MLTKVASFIFLACATSAPAFALDTAALDDLLEKQQYKEVVQQLGNKGDPESLAYMRSRYMEWHYPLNAHFYAVRYLPVVSPPNEGRKPMLTQDELFEATRAWARAKTILYVDRRDCKTLNRQVRDWNESFDIASTMMQAVLGNYPNAMYTFGYEAPIWAKEKESGALRPPAIWYCGEGNTLPDSERTVARKKALAALEAQLQVVAQGVQAPNPGLRDKAAPRL